MIGQGGCSDDTRAHQPDGEVRGAGPHVDKNNGVKDHDQRIPEAEERFALHAVRRVRGQSCRQHMVVPLNPHITLQAAP